MPMFKGKGKLKTQDPEIVNTRQNYDYSGMNMAAATSNAGRPKDGEEGQQPRDGGDRRYQNNRNQAQAAEESSEDDF